MTPHDLAATLPPLAPERVAVLELGAAVAAMRRAMQSGGLSASDAAEVAEAWSLVAVVLGRVKL